MNERRTIIRPVILYDGECAMCTTQMRWLTKLDWFHSFEPLPNADPRVPRLAPQLQRADLDAAIYCVTSDGRALRAARCLRHVGMRVPLLFPLALLLWIPGFLWIADKVYAWVANNRYILSRFFKCRSYCEREEEQRGDGEHAVTK